jgi:hypothetical protein
METNKKATQEELLKAVVDVLDEALAEYDQLQKSMGVQEMPKQAEGIDNAQVIADPTKPSPAPAPAVKADAAPGEPVAAPMAKDEEPAMEEKEEDEEEKKKKKEEEEKKSDDELMMTYKSITAQLEAKGLLKKSEPEAAPAPVAEEKGEEFRKSVDERFEKLTASIAEVSETIKKFASAPVPRRGVVGYAPLKKTEGSEAAPLHKGEVVNKLLDLRKGGERSIDTALINRVETGRLVKGDLERIKHLGILG